MALPNRTCTAERAAVFALRADPTPAARVPASGASWEVNFRVAPLRCPLGTTR